MNENGNSSHSENPTFKCKFCGKSFSERNVFKCHEKTCDNFMVIPRSSSSAASATSAAVSVQSSGDCNQIKCRYCSSSFTLQKNCSRHEKGCQKNPLSSSNFVCELCGTTSNRYDNHKAHVRKCKDKHLSSGSKSIEEESKQKKNSSNGIKKSKSKTPCLFPDCDLEFFHKKSLLEHLKTVHEGVNLQDPVSKKFNSTSEFHVWKDEEQARTFSYFSKKSGQNASKIQYFYCQHDGLSHSARKTGRVKLVGQVKVGHYCIAKMQVWKDTEDKINLLYYPTHSHHCSPSDLVHQPLSKKDDMYINEKIAWGVSPTKILRDIQKNCIPTTSSLDQIQNFKAAVITKKRIRERARKRREKRRYHKEEAKAVFLMVNELSKDRDCVVLYKPYGHDVQIGPKEINSLPDHKQLFMLGLQTKEQAALMVEHSHKIVLVDETHGTNHHKYQLLTLMIIDDNNRGWPVAHLISSKSDADTLQYFFRALKEKHGNADNLNLNCIISDDDSALINAMDLGFEGKLGSLRHILCKWHLLRAFKKNLRSHVPKSFVDTMMDELRVLVNETDQKTFYDLQAGFIAKYESLDQCKSFITEYYRKYYVDRVTKWAMCFRNFPHANINTTGHIESFHHRLKKVYLKRKVNRRLDDLVNILIDIEWDDKIRRVRESVVGMAYQPHEILDRHKRGMQISDEDLVKIDENTWDIKSSSGKDNYYIARYHEKCPLDHCFLKCTQILCGGLCSHIYSCSCKDTNPLCKHVHKLHSLLMRDIVKQVRDNACNVDFVPDEPCNEEAFHIPKSTPPENRRTLSHQFVELEENLSQLAEILSSAKGNQRPLKNANAIDHATTVTRELILQLKYMCEDDDVDEVPFMEPAVKFNSNEKLKTQVSQLLPFKKPAAKRKRKEAGVSPERKKAIKKDLLGILDSDNPDDPGSSSEPLGFIPSDDPGRSSKSLTSFTPPLSFAPNPCDVILKCGYEQISLLALKSLEYQMSDEEKQECRMLDPAFTCGWLYSSVINAYLNSLEDQYPLCLALSSDLAIRASRGQSNLRVLQKSFADSQKDVVLLPCNLSGYHWCIIAVHLTTPKILYYDPLQGELSQPTQTLLFQLSKDLNSLLPLNSGWKTIVYVKAVKQDDSYNCGVYACAFAEQMARKSLPFQKPTNINAFRKKIYDSIVGGCLRDMNLERCSICYEDFSQQFENDNRTWISCKKCDKWFHEDCVTNSTVHFVCPS